LAGLCGVCAALGYATSRERLIAGALVGVFIATAVFALAGRVRFTASVLATLPWLVTLNTLIPKLALTFVSAAGALLLLSLTRPRDRPSSLSWIGTSLFSLILLIGAIESEAGEQLIEAAKYSVLPVMVLVVTSRSGRERLVDMRLTLLWSGVGAMAAQGAIVLLHLGATSTKYGAGEQLGFATQNPHELALVGVIVAVACLVTIHDIRWRLIGAAIAVAPALATGVRSALAGVSLALIVLAIRARFRPSVVLGIATLCAVIILSGVGTIIATRYQQDQAKGEFSSIATFGSDRGALWTVALHHWSASGPRGIVFGSGLRSIERIEAQGLFSPNATAQSDPITILVELGILGLLAWLLIWLALVSSGINWLLLLPLASYAVTNGSLEYVGGTVFGVALAGACTSRIGSARLQPGLASSAPVRLTAASPSSS
jgi:O-Antigen ligase